MLGKKTEESYYYVDGVVYEDDNICVPIKNRVEVFSIEDEYYNIFDLDHIKEFGIESTNPILVFSISDSTSKEISKILKKT
jgi:hypothetical protein